MTNDVRIRYLVTIVAAVWSPAQSFDSLLLLCPMNNGWWPFYAYM